MVQQVIYAQEIKELGEKKEVAVKSSIKTLHHFIDNEDFIRVGKITTFLPTLPNKTTDDSS